MSHPLTKKYSLIPPITITWKQSFDIWYVVMEWANLLVTDSGRFI